MTPLSRSEHRKPAFWERQRPRHLITGLAKCGVCGSSYVKINRTLFGCAGVKDRGTCNNRLNIKGEVLENTILDLLKTKLMEPEPFKAFCQELFRETNRLRLAASSSVDAQRAELAGVERRLSRIVAMITDDDAPVRALKAELIELEKRQTRLQEALSTSAEPEPLIHPGTAELYHRQVASLHEALGDPETHDQAFELIRSLIEEIRLIPDGGTLRIELRGELAGILALTSESKQARSRETAGLAEQIKMVAGTRNQLCRTKIR